MRGEFKSGALKRQVTSYFAVILYEEAKRILSISALPLRSLLLCGELAFQLTAIQLDDSAKATT
jgi:hypothetical protein